MKSKYLIDANLPCYFGLWNSPDYIHIKDIDDTLSDNEIWNYAKLNDFIIITKDADFSLKVLTEGSPPKVIHIRFGNMKMKEFHQSLSKMWVQIQEAISENDLINVYSDKIESVRI